MSRYTRIIYGFLFVVIVLEPHVITGHVIFLPPAFAQSLITLLLGGIAFIVYTVHQHEVRHKELERLGIVHELDQSTHKLNQAYEYIGTLNRRLPLLKKITSELLSRPKINKRNRRAIFEDLLATAVISIAKVPWGIFRFVDTLRLKTAREFTYYSGHGVLLHATLGNKELMSAHKGEDDIASLDDIYVVPTSDEESPTCCLYIFPKHNKVPTHADIQILQAIVDQAQLFYKYIF